MMSKLMIQCFFSIFTPIAKYFLALMATSVTSEFLFSQSGIIATELRNRICPFLLEDLTLLKENNFFES